MDLSDKFAKLVQECVLNDSSDTSDNPYCDSGSEYLPSDESRNNSPTRFSSLYLQSGQRDLEQPEPEQSEPEQAEPEEPEPEQSELEQPEPGEPEPIRLLQDQILDETTGHFRDATPETNRQENENTKSRKRVRNEQKWARNERKIKRAKGEEYISQKGILVPQKQMTPGPCPCPLKCHEVINLERQVKIFKDFYALESFDLQSAFLFSSIKVVPKNRSYAGESQKRTNTRIYYLINDAGEESRVCKLFYLKTLQVSNGRVDRVLKNKGNLSMPPKDKRGKFPPANKTSTDKINEVMEFISKFPAYESHYSRKKTERKYLSPNLNLRIMYNLYKESVEQPLSESMFRKVFNEKFNLSFHPLVTDSCKKCDGFNVKIAAASNEEDKKQLETERELHQRKADSARKGLQEDTLLAKSDPKVTCITFDLMKTLPTPVLSTGICYYKRQLWTYCMGIHNAGTDDAYMYLWDETVASRGPQEVGSCLLHYIKTNVRTEKLIMYSDQCGGQNRNIKMAVLCNYIVSSPDFTVTEIHHKFLVSGHSYLPCDQDFGLIEKEKKYFTDRVQVPAHWRDVIKSARKRQPFHIIEMTSDLFFSTKSLEKNITHRKISQDNMKVEWLKIQYLKFEKNKPDKINYSYSNYENCENFHVLDVHKRNSGVVSRLDLLYPSGNTVTDLKKKDLITLLPYIPPNYHSFYSNLKTNNGPDLLPLPEEEEEY